MCVRARPAARTARLPAHSDLTLVGPEFLSVTCQNTQQPHQLCTQWGRGRRRGQEPGKVRYNSTWRGAQEWGEELGAKEIHHGLKMCTQSTVMCVFSNDRVTDVVLVSTG